MYREFFGLTAKPFQLSPDAAFFYPSSEHRRALSFLEYGVDQADGFIVVTGAVGTGKSTLVQALLRDLDPEQIRVATIVTSHLRQDDLLVWVASRFGLEVAGLSKAVVLRDLEQFLIEQAKSQRRVLLIVDEVQNLPREAVEELRMLSNFVLDGRPLIQVFLVGQNEFRDTLLSPGFEQLRQRVIATYHLNPLSESETRTYIEYRLSLVEWRHDPEFTTEAFNAIYRYSDGVPRRINNLCDRLLLFAYLEELHRIDGAHVRLVAEEIGDEFRPAPPQSASIQSAPGIAQDHMAPGRVAQERVTPGRQDSEPPRHAVEAPGQPLEAMARVMFDKANVQQRLAALERAIDSLGQSLKPELVSLKEELVYVRGLLEDLVTESRAQQSSYAARSGKFQRSANQ